MRFVQTAILVAFGATLGACATFSPSPSASQTNSNAVGSAHVAQITHADEDRTDPISTPAARYPSSLLHKCVGGIVKFTVTVLDDGHVSDVSISSSPSDELSRTVTDTITKQWLFKPYDAGDPKTLAKFKSYMNFDPHCR
jgi:outer membrane biosynthesis protein TonB